MTPGHIFIFIISSTVILAADWSIAVGYWIVFHCLSINGNVRIRVHVSYPHSQIEVPKIQFFRKKIQNFFKKKKFQYFSKKKNSIFFQKKNSIFFKRKNQNFSKKKKSNFFSKKKKSNFFPKKKFKYFSKFF